MRPALVGALFVVLAVPAFAGEAPLVAESDLFVPEVLETAACTACIGSYTTSPGGGAASHWGKGTSCAAAQTDLTSQTRSVATGFCLGIDDYGTCSFTVVVTGACWWSSDYGLYVVDGYANFKCREWIGGPGCIIP